MSGPQCGTSIVRVFLWERVEQRRGLSGVVRAFVRRFFLSPITDWPAADSAEYKLQRRGKKGMSNILILLAIVGIWVLLQVYILPKFGIST
jgi:hypothetical protein